MTNKPKKQAKNIRKERFWKNIGRYFNYIKLSWKEQVKEYFRNSSLHGVKYIAQNDGSFLEKFVWFLFVVTGAISACFVMLSLLKKFQTYPTITGLNTDFHNWEVAFPAIILCPENMGNINDVTDIFLTLSENPTYEVNSTARFLHDFSHLTLNSIPEFVEKYRDFSIYKKQFHDLRAAVIKVQYDCTEFLENCIFKAESFNCCNGYDKGFFPVFTESGFCYSFNSRHFEKINFTDTPFNMQYIKETDRKWSLQFSMKVKDVVSTLYIINPNEMIGIDVQSQYQWQTFEIDKISFSVKQTETTDDARQLSIKQRRCIFDDEIKLKVNDFYSYTSCTLQCRMETALRLCGCVPYFYPHIPHFPYCPLNKYQCIADNLKKIKQIDHCQCQLSCSYTVYEIESLNSVSEKPEIDSIEIEFDSWPMVRYKRQVIFGWVDLLVSFGGVAGLFLGFSLLSGVEIIYYFTIRTCVSANETRQRAMNQTITKSIKSKNTIISVIPYNFPMEPVLQKRQSIKFNLKQKTEKKRPIDGYGIVFRSIEIGGTVMAERKILPPFGIEFIN